MRIPSTPAPETIAFLALGAVESLNSASENQRIVAMDLTDGYLGFLSHAVSDALWIDRVWSALNERDAEPATVWDYEVTEPYGKWWGAYVCNHKAFPPLVACREKLTALIADASDGEPDMAVIVECVGRALAGDRGLADPPPTGHNRVDIRVERDDDGSPQESYSLTFAECVTGQYIEQVVGIEPDRVSSTIGAHLADMMSRPGPR